MYPVAGGAGRLRESTLHFKIMEIGLSLLKALNLRGVPMVEFKVDPRGGLPKLMEINPRFWGSLQYRYFHFWKDSLTENLKSVSKISIG